ncbi:hypothetical protein TIFTF001_027736 [Ficus carica]|uniref:Uncharacterized protein n=1 Tax=Ficus carica TaxID=3494 RepID=A0AA88DNK5_FICCA|nr:hypothetical protein TIFTF001_027736 [Ficus carica]
MASPIPYSVADDHDLDDAALWAVIDSAAASFKSRKPLAVRNNPNSFHSPTPPLKLQQKTSRNFSDCSNSKVSVEGEVVQETWVFRPPRKIARTACSSSFDFGDVSPMAVARTNVQQRTPSLSVYSSPEKYLSPGIEKFAGSECSPESHGRIHEKESSGHSLSGNFPSVSLFKEYQNAAMAAHLIMMKKQLGADKAHYYPLVTNKAIGMFLKILEKTDYTMISGHPFIKKSGWRKISFYFNLSYEIRDKTIEFDDNRNVQRAEFVVRAYMQGGRFSDGWGSCERREKKFLKPNHDIPSTAETRAKNKACQDLLGIGEYRPGAAAGHANR